MRPTEQAWPKPGFSGHAASGGGVQRATRRRRTSWPFESARIRCSERKIPFRGVFANPPITRGHRAGQSCTAPPTSRFATTAAADGRARPCQPADLLLLQHDGRTGDQVRDEHCRAASGTHQLIGPGSRKSEPTTGRTAPASRVGVRRSTGPGSAATVRATSRQHKTSAFGIVVPEIQADHHPA